MDRVRVGTITVTLSYTAGGSNRGLHLILKKGAVERTIWRQFPVQEGSHSWVADTNTGDIPVVNGFLLQRYLSGPAGNVYYGRLISGR